MSFKSIFKSIAGEGLTNVLVGAGLSAALAGIVATFMGQQNVKRVEQSNNATINQLALLMNEILSNEVTCARTFNMAMPAQGGSVSFKNAGGREIESLQPGASLGNGRKRVLVDNVVVAEVRNLDSVDRRKITVSATFTTEELSMEGVVAKSLNETRYFTVYGANVDSNDDGVNDSFSCLGNFTGDEMRPETLDHICYLIMDVPSPPPTIGIYPSGIAFRTTPANDQCHEVLQGIFANPGGERGSFPLIMDQVMDAQVPAPSGADPICAGAELTDVEYDSINERCRFRLHGSRCSSGMMTGINNDGVAVLCANIIIAPQP